MTESPTKRGPGRPRKEKTVPLHVNIPVELDQRIRSEAEKRDMTLSRFVQRALEAAVPQAES